jgi:HEAT repeat protein
VAAANLAASQVAEVALQFRRVFSLYRMYGLTHELTAQVEREAHLRLAELLKLEPQLTLLVQPTALKYGELTVLEDERKEDATIRTLFADGVESITFHAELQTSELSAYLRAWFGAVSGQLGPEHTFSTLIWEADYANISTSLRSGLAEHGVNEAQKKNAQSRVAALLAAAQSQPVDGAGGALVDGHALAALAQVEAFAQLQPGELARVADAEQTAAQELSRSERASLLAGLLASRRGVGQRLLFGLWAALKTASVAERQAAVDLVTQVVRLLVAERRSPEVCRALARIAESGRADPSREQLLSEFLGCLNDPEVVAGVVKLLETPDNATLAQALLHYLPPALAEQLLTPMERAPKDQARRLIAALVQKAPSAEELAMWLVDRGEAAAPGIFSAAEQLSPEHVALLARAALIHDEAPVRLRGLRAVRTEEVGAYRSLILPLLQDPNPEVREQAVQALVRAKDAQVVPILIAQLDAADAGPDVLRLCVRALGSLGGEAPARRLLGVLRDAKDKELKRAAALALGQSGWPGAIEPLRAEAQRLFGDRLVKEACKEALRRLEPTRGAGEEGGPT